MNRPKTPEELRAKLEEMLTLDARKYPVGMIYSKSAACKTLLWALGENEDKFYIRSAPGPAVDVRAKDRN